MIPHNRWTNRPEYEAAALRVLRSGHVAQGPEVRAFEEELAARFRPGGAACVVSSGTAALYLARYAMGFVSGLGPGVRVPTYACAALYHAACLGRDDTPRLCDSDTESFAAPAANLRPHVYGVPRWFPRGECVEDFTHAPGASLDGRPCGSLGALSVISFGATKPLGIGAGGAVLGPVEAIEEIRDRRDYDGKPDLRPRFNWQFGDVYAAIGRDRLRRLDEENAWRKATAKEYLLHTPAGTGVHGHDAVFDRTISGRVWYRFVIRAMDPQAAQAHFAAAGVETIVPLRPDELLHRLLGMDPERFPVAEEIARTTLSLPIWPGMTAEEVSRVADALAALEDE